MHSGPRAPKDFAVPALPGDIVENLVSLDFVMWDRFAVSADGDIVVYGWVSRDDGRADFVVLEYPDWSDGVGVITSSAKWSKEISKRLGGGDAHRGCQRIEDAVPELGNVIRLHSGRR